MNPLPIILSIPHAGLDVPPEVAHLHDLGADEIAADGDGGAAGIYRPLASHVAHCVTTEVARAFVDMNRAEDDIRKDGVVKTHTCWDVPIYRAPLSSEIVESLLARYHRPYHAQLTALAGRDVLAGVDSHTMAERGPNVGPDPGSERPAVCIGDGGGAFPRAWAEAMVDCFRTHYGGEVTLNQPFAGGYITRYHGREIPWVQIELNRGASMSEAEKSRRVLASLRAWCEIARGH